MSRYTKKHSVTSFSSLVESLNLKQNDEALPSSSSIEEKLSELLNNSHDKISMSSFNRDIGEEFGAEEYEVPTESYFKQKQNSSLLTKPSFEYLSVDYAGIQEHEGLVFFGLFALSDAEIPCFLIVYFDDKDRLRAYIPKKGNAYNPLYKSCLGIDPLGDNEYMESIGQEFDFMERYEEDSDFRLSLFNNKLLFESIIKRIVIK
ncbi:hypothetical protein ACQR3P_28830 [Rhodococcus sp. IEGM1300]